MAPAAIWLLDTNVLLHWVRGSKTAEAIDAQFHLREAGFRPLICEVSLGEIEAFARSRSWGPDRRSKLKALKRELVAVDISDDRVIDALADISTVARAHGWPIFNDKNDLWIAAATRASGATLLTTDKKAFLPLRDAGELSAVILDPLTGLKLP